MKLKQYTLIIASSFLTLLSTSSMAGREGVSFYYGLGAGAAAPAEATLVTTGTDFTALGTSVDIDFDPTGMLEIMLGIEEDGWAIEGILGQSMDTGTDIDDLDYNLQTMEIGLGYRTIEKNDRYYKIKYSKTDVDIELDYSPTDAKDTFETEGDSITFGMGFRMDREEKMEIDYTYHDNDDTEEVIHFINVRYLWGGAKYYGKGH